MKLYLAGERDIFTERGVAQGWAASTNYVELMASVIKRRLFSFYYHGFKDGKGGASGKIGADGLSPDVRYTASTGMDMFLDSGAFTAFTQKLTIPVDEFAGYIHKTAKLWNVISNLDAIGGTEQASWDNLKALESLGCRVAPVFHARENPKWLTRYIDNYDYILLGGLVPETTQWLLAWLDDIWHKYLTNPDGTARVKVHGFGLTDQKVMFRYPWHSVDSSSWLMTGIFGACIFRIPDTRKFSKVIFSDSSPQARNLTGWHYKRLVPAQRQVIDGWLKPYGITAAQCGEHYTYRDVINAATFQNMEDMAATSFTPDQIKLGFEQ